MTDVGELFVRVRPSTAGFTEEATPGVQSAGLGLGKVFLAAFAAVGVGDVVKKTLEAAVSQQSTFATLNKTVENAGAANTVHGQTVDNLVKQQAALKGFSVTDEAGAVAKLDSVTRNSAEAFSLLGDAEDLARGTGKSLAVSALGVEKAYEGSATSLSRYGIIIKPVVSGVQALADAHAKAADAGETFTAQQNAAYAVQVKNATLADKVLTGQEAIAAIQQRFGGEASTFASTAAGDYDRLKVSVDQLGVSFGSDLLPLLSSGAADLARWADEVESSTSVQNAAKTAANDLASGLHDVEDVAKTVGPPLADVAKFAYEVVSAVGAPALLAAAGTFEGIKVATSLAKDAQAAYNAVLIAGGATKVAAVTETQALTVALTENTAALRGQMIAAGEDQLAIEGLGATAVTAAGEVAAAGDVVGGSFLGGLGALATGPGALLIGVTALAGGITYLLTRESDWTAANHAVQGSSGDLTSALNAEKQAVQQLNDAVASGNQVDITAARHAAAAAAANETASLQKAADAYTKLGQAAQQYNVGGSLHFAAVLFGQGTHSENDIQAAQKFVEALGQETLKLGDQNPLLTHNIGLLEQLTDALKSVPPTTDIQLLINNQDPSASLALALSGLSNLQQALENISAAAQGTPLGGSAASIYSARTSPAIAAEYAAQNAAAAVKADVTGGKTHQTLTEAAQLTITQLQQGIALAQSQQQDLDAQMVDAVQQGALAVQQSVAQAQQNFITIGQSIASDIGTYIDTPLTLTGDALQSQADRIAAIQQGLVTRFAGQNALLDQETNRISLRAAQLTLHEQAASVELPGGHGLSANPAQALRQLEALQKTASPAGKFALQQLIDAYQTDVIAVQKAKIAVVSQQPVAQAQASADNALNQAHLRSLQDRATFEKTAATSSINDWASEWETKKITLQRFNDDVAALIRKDVGSLGDVSKIPGGELLEQQLRGALSGAKLQAQAIAAGPQIAGAGFLPDITHPLTALQNEQKQIASIAHSDASNAATIATDQRNILKAIYGATKNTAGLSSLAKNPPTAAQVHSALTGVGIG